MSGIRTPGPGTRGHRVAATVATVAAAGLAGGMLLAGAGPVMAATCPAATATTVTFCDTGAAQTWTVPAGVTDATFTLYGADGAAGAGAGGGSGGDGAEVTGTLPVIPGTVLQVDVEQAGATDTGGFGGGGSGAAGGQFGSGGGGGASYVVSPAADGTYPFANALMVAAGGGGGGATGSASGGAGGDASAPGGTGTALTSPSCGQAASGGAGGRPGTASSAGSGGTGGTCTTGSSGSTGNPGMAGTGGSAPGGDTGDGGGGGGGWYGGGSGGGSATDGSGNYSGAGGGGGGSSYTGTAANPLVLVDNGTSPDDGANGEVIISYPLTVTTTSLPAGTVNDDYSATLSAANGTSPYSWSLASGSSLPAGLSLASDGQISGTPSVAATATFTVRAADSSSPAQTATKTLSITVRPAPLVITTSMLPDGIAGTAYSQPLAASGGTTPYSWSVTSGTLPTGLSLTAGGLISGTPKQPGSSSFTVQVTDSGSPQLSSSAGLSITVGKATPGVTLTVTPSSEATVTTPVTLSAAIADAAGLAAPTGSVTFTVNGSPAGCGTAGVVTVTAGAASCMLGDLAAGSYSFAAAYSGDSNYLSGQAGQAGYAVGLLSQAVTFTSSVPPTADYGGSYVPAATGGGSGNPVTFAASGACTLSASGGTVSFTGTGTCTVTASQAGNSQYAAGQAQQQFTVSPATTKTTVTVTATALTATVTAVAPGGGTPSGTVTFMVGGADVGTADLNSAGVATLAFASASGETVAASYAGSTDYLPSSGSTATTNPVITASLTSKFAKSKYGWYRAPVTVTFTCTPGSAPLTAPCPSPVTLRSNGAGQVVSKTIHATDGGVGTVSVTVSIDQRSPSVSVSGIKNGTTYDAPGPGQISCKATESLSGLAAPCKLTVKRAASAITWTATATSKAGLTTTHTGKATLLDFYVAGARRVNGRFVVTDRKAFTLVAYVLSTARAPRYVYATKQGTRPHKTGPAMKKTASHLWALQVTIATRMSSRSASWTAGIRVGKHLYTVPLTLQR